MVKLEPQDHKQLREILRRVDFLAHTPRERREVLDVAGLGEIAARIDFNGPQDLVINRIIDQLSRYGRLSYEHEALGIFLNDVKSMLGIGDKTVIDELLIKYNMMTPVATADMHDDWQGSSNIDHIKEKIIGENTLKPIAFLAQGLNASTSVGMVMVTTTNDRWTGTGFLIDKDLLLTCQHVVPNTSALLGCKVRFSYEDDFKGNAKQPMDFMVEPNGIFHTNEELDYAVIEVNESPGKTFGILDLNKNEIPRVSDRVNIIQHPGGRAKEISFQNNYVESVGDNLLQYITSTEPGSSGSPVLNEKWEVVGLHHGGGNLLDPTSKRRYFRNEGTLISSILNDLPQKIRGKLPCSHLFNE